MSGVSTDASTMLFPNNNDIRWMRTNSPTTSCDEYPPQQEPGTFPQHWSHRFKRALNSTPNACCMDMVQMQCKFGCCSDYSSFIPESGSSNEGGAFCLPSCSVITLGGNARLCAENKVLVQCLKPPTVTCVFAVRCIAGVTTRSERVERVFYSEEVFSLKIEQRITTFIESARRRDPQYAKYHSQLASRYGGNHIGVFVINRCTEHNKFIHCGDKALQALLMERIKQTCRSFDTSGDSMTRISQYQQENKLSQWMTMFKAGCPSALNPIDETLGIDHIHGSKLDSRTHCGFGMSREYGLCEDIYASHHDDGSLNMFFSAELGACGVIGIYSKKIHKSKRFDFLLNQRKERVSRNCYSETNRAFKITKTFSTFKRKYYIVCKCDAGHTAAEAYRMFVSSNCSSSNAPTLEEFYQSRAYALYSKQCLENARRLAFNFACSIGLEVVRIEDMPSFHESCVSQGYYNSPELRRTFYNTDRKFDDILLAEIRARQPVTSTVASNDGGQVDNIGAPNRFVVREEAPSQSTPIMVEIIPSSETQSDDDTYLPVSKETLVNLLYNGNDESCVEFSKYENELLQESSTPDLEDTRPLTVINVAIIDDTSEPKTNTTCSTPCECCCCSPCCCGRDGSTSIQTPSSNNYDWKTYRTELCSGIGKPILAQEKYRQFDGLITRIPVPCYAGEQPSEGLSYKWCYQVSSGVLSTASSCLVNQRRCMMKVNLMQGYVIMKPAPQVLCNPPCSAVFPMKMLSNQVTTVMQRVEREAIYNAFTRSCFLPTLLGYKGSGYYWREMSEYDRMSYQVNPELYECVAKYNHHFYNRGGNSEMSVDDIFQRVCTRHYPPLLTTSISTSTVSKSNDGEYDTSTATKSSLSSSSMSSVSEEDSSLEESSEEEGNQNVSGFYANPDVGNKFYGLNRKWAELYKVGKTDSKIIKPGTSEKLKQEGSSVGCHYCGQFNTQGSFSKCPCGCACYSGCNCGCVGTNCPCSCSCNHTCQSGPLDQHCVEGIEITRKAQVEQYVELLCRKAYTPQDAWIYRQKCAQSGSDFCCFCGNTSSPHCSAHPCGMLCQRNPHINPLCLTKEESTLTNIPETIAKIQQNVLNQCYTTFESFPKDGTCQSPFAWSHLVPVAFVSSDSSYVIREGYHY